MFSTTGQMVYQELINLDQPSVCLLDASELPKGSIKLLVNQLESNSNNHIYNPNNKPQSAKVFNFVNP